MKRVHFQRNKGSKLILPKPRLKNLIKPKLYTQQHNKLKDRLVDKINVEKDR